MRILLLSNLSIRGKLISIVMISSSLALLLVGIAFVFYDYTSSKDALSRSMEILTDVTANNCNAAVQFGSVTDANSTLHALRAERQVHSADVYTTTGELFATYSRELLPGPSPHASGSNSRQIAESDMLVLVRPIQLDGETIGSIKLRVELYELTLRIKRDILMVGLLVLVAMLMAFLVISRLQRVISGPILDLATVSGTVSRDGDYTVRAVPRGSDEVSFLVGSFNNMLEQVHKRDLELLAARDDLELRVKERTAELEDEIAERVQAQEQIVASLREKEVLLKEVHHRVKNNLQIITSLLNLQAANIKDRRLEAMFRDSQGRVKTMALIHEKLYRSENLSEVDFADYVDSLVRFMMSTTSGNRERISVKQNVERTLLGVDIAIPCGLIINELVTNSLKYAFPNEEEGVITINCRKQSDSGRLLLSVADNGVGVPIDLDFETLTSLGMQLVSSLTDQLGATMQLHRDGGTQFDFEIPMERTQSKVKQHANA